MSIELITLAASLVLNVGLFGMLVGTKSSSVDKVLSNLKNAVDAVVVKKQEVEAAQIELIKGVPEALSSLK